MPQMNDVIEGWTCEIMTNQRRQMLQDGIITNVDTFVKMRGVIQPLKAEDIALKPEEQRSWAWYEIHVTNNFDVLKNNQVIYIDKRNADGSYGANVSGMLQSKTVGNVSASYVVPQRYLKNPYFAFLAQTGFGNKYLSYILPRSVARCMWVAGRSLP